ncbi:MAG: hypothetical protein NTY12_02335 [Candidatus Falkowbacteria bacterium]|nr:hypothetical protein [Candidatus Falkowbacteria bacterium]
MFKEKAFNKPSDSNGNTDYIVDGENVAERREKLKRIISSIQLAYADSIYRQQTDEEKKSFSDILEDVNAYVVIEKLRSVDRIETNANGLVEERKELNPLFTRKIDNLYESQCLAKTIHNIDEQIDALQPIKDYVEDLEKQSRAKYQKEWAEDDLRKQKNENEVEKAGLFTLRNIDEHSTNKNVKKLKEEHFSDKDEFIEIVIPDVFASGEKFSKESILNSLRETANSIIDKHPNVAAVIGNSWLLSSPSAKKIIPFKILETDNFTNWSQLVDKDGNIHKERFNDFISSGKLPYNSLFGYMPSEEFVRRFSDRKGKINLKEINPVWVEENKDREFEQKEEESKIKKMFNKDTIILAENVDSMFDDFPVFKTSLEAAGIYNQFLSILKSGSGLTMNQINKKFSNEMTVLGAELKNHLTSEKYINKEIIL